MTLTVQDLEKLQAEHPDYRMELVDGEIRVMSPYPQQEKQVLGDGDILTMPELLPGWEVAVSDLWPLVFE